MDLGPRPRTLTLNSFSGLLPPNAIEGGSRSCVSDCVGGSMQGVHEPAAPEAEGEKDKGRRMAEGAAGVARDWTQGRADAHKILKEISGK